VSKQIKLFQACFFSFAAMTACAEVRSMGKIDVALDKPQFKTPSQVKLVEVNSPSTGAEPIELMGARTESVAHVPVKEKFTILQDDESLNLVIR